MSTVKVRSREEGGGGGETEKEKKDLVFFSNNLCFHLLVPFGQMVILVM